MFWDCNGSYKKEFLQLYVKIGFEPEIYSLWRRYMTVKTVSFFFREFWTTYRNWNYKTLWDKTNEDDILQSRALLWNSHLWRQSYDLKIRHNTLNCPILSIYVFPPIICKTWKGLVQLFLNGMLLANKIQQKFRMNVPGWQKLCEGTKGLRRKVWTRMNISRPSIRYFVPISDLSWFWCFLEDLGAKKFFGTTAVFLGQGVYYGMYCILHWIKFAKWQ